MENNFNQPQRQSTIGILVMFVDSLQKVARAFLPLLLVFFFKSENLSKWLVLLGIIALFVIVAIVAYLKFINFTFFIDDENDEFIIQDGIINKTKTTIQLDKIQQVNISQSLIQRLIGVYALDVDTAGSDNKEGNIKAISHELALALKAKLLENKAYNKITEAIVSHATEREVQQTEPFLRIHFLSLIKVGITSNYVKTIGLLLTFFFTIMENLENIGKDDVIDDKVEQFMTQNAVWYFFLIIIIGLFTVVFIINIVRTIVKYFNYTITKQKGSLLLSFGLISTKSTIVKPEKVQVISVSRNYFQKKLNVLEVRIKQAVRDEKQHHKSQIEVPGCNENEKNEIMQLIFNELPQKGLMLKPNFRKLGFSIFLVIVLPLTGFFMLGNYAQPKLLNYYSFALVYALFFLVILSFGFRNYRLFVNEKHIIKQSGAWDIENEIIEIGKIQALSTSQLFWHKNLNIGSLTLHTAGGNVTFHLGNYNKIKDYINLWLYQIEASNKNWM
ncbi:MAG: PH domain-containing protein [Flavobacterium sp.]|nr:PH domain-containing protein [Flavobacterium sp.]